MFFTSIFSALTRAKYPILSVALTYLAAILVGIIMVNGHVQFAVDTRDKIVNQAYNGCNSTINALQNGSRIQAALLDFGSNLFLGAMPNTLAGLGVITAYPIVAYRGWVGGIVSIDGSHISRLSTLHEAVYYLVTLLLQIIPYSLAGGAGVKLGIEFYRQMTKNDTAKWFVIPRAALADVFRIYLLVIPLFLIASLWEFIMA